jgi:hypothetical protein
MARKMTDLLEKLRQIAKQASESDAQVIEAAIDHIEELKIKLTRYEEDVTDWQVAVETQMGRRLDDK